MGLAFSRAFAFWNQEDDALTLIDALLRTFLRLSELPPGISDRQERLGHLILDRLLPFSEGLQQYKEVKRMFENSLKNVKAKDVDIINRNKNNSKDMSVITKGDSHETLHR